MSWFKVYGGLSSVASFLANIVKIGGGLAAVLAWMYGQNWIASLGPSLSWVNAQSRLSWTLAAVLCLGFAWTGVAWGRRMAEVKVKRPPKPRKMPIVDLILLELFAHAVGGGSLDSNKAHEMLEHMHKNASNASWADSVMCKGYSMVQVKAGFARISDYGLIEYGYLNYHLSKDGLAYYDKYSDAITQILGLN